MVNSDWRSENTIAHPRGAKGAKAEGGGQLWFQLYTAGEGGREEVGEENGTIYQSEYIIVISRNL